MLDYKAIENWSNLVDELDDQLLDRELEIPDFQGETWVDPLSRTWRKVQIAYGKPGGRWCYWNHDGRVVADSIFNGNSSFFAGMLRIPYDGAAKTGLMIENVPNTTQSKAQEDGEDVRRPGSPVS